MGIIASLECVPTVVLIVFRPYLTCLSHLHWEVGPFIMPISRGGVRIAPPPSRRAACSVPQGVSEGPCSAPTPRLLTPAARRMRETVPADSVPGRPMAGTQSGGCKGASCSFQNLQAPRERDEQGNDLGVSPQGHRSDNQAHPC